MEEEEEEDKDEDKEGDRNRDTPRGAQVEVGRAGAGGGVPPLEENADLPDFTP